MENNPFVYQLLDVWVYGEQESAFGAALYECWLTYRPVCILKLNS